jgi:hypothetical protein
LLALRVDVFGRLAVGLAFGTLVFTKLSNRFQASECSSMSANPAVFLAGLFAMADTPIGDPATRPWVSFKSDQHPIPDDLARELAALVIEWSGFEAAIDLDSQSMRRRSPVVEKLFEDEPRSFERRIVAWRDAVKALYPNDDGYKDIASVICSAGKFVGRHRHAIIHGHWLPPERAGAPFRLRLTKRLGKLPEGCVVPAAVGFVTAVHVRLRRMSDDLWMFTTNRMLHGRRVRKPKPPEPKP